MSDAHRQWRTARGKKLRARKLRLTPLCEWCVAGRCQHAMQHRRLCTTQATEVDHVVPLEQGGAVFDWSNLQSLCQDCHTDKTRQDLGQKPRPRIGADGYPLAEPKGRGE